jgi:hypothetical protein
MYPCSLQFAWSSQRSVAKILPSTVPRTFTDFVLISPLIAACSPTVSVPLESIVPSTSPAMNIALRNLTEPLIETPCERKEPDCFGMKVPLDGAVATHGSAGTVCGGSVFSPRGKRRRKSALPSLFASTEIAFMVSEILARCSWRLFLEESPLLPRSFSLPILCQSGLLGVHRHFVLVEPN